MYQVFSATQARIHFGELILKAQSEPIMVERNGKVEVVILSKVDYDELKSAAKLSGWRTLLQEAHQLIRNETSNYPLPSPEEILYQIREEHDEQFGRSTDSSRR